MSFTQQYEQDLELGCVCDFDVPCPSHPRATTPHDACEYAGYCSQVCPWYNGEPGSASDDFKAKAPAAFRLIWISAYRNDTECDLRAAELAFERMEEMQS